MANAMEECVTLGAAAYYSARRDRATEAREMRLSEQPGLDPGIAGLHRLSSAQAASSAIELESIGREPGPRLKRFCADRNPPPPLLGL